MPTYRVHDVYHSHSASPKTVAKLIYQTWSMEGCESHTDYFLSRNIPGYYWYGPHEAKDRKRVNVEKLQARFPFWELVVVPRHPEA